jgi:DNA-binding CsgD family transcriptional regulator
MRAVASIKDTDGVVDALYSKVAPKLRLLAMWPTEQFDEWEAPQSLDTILYHRSVPATFRERLGRSIQVYGPSILAQMAFLDPAPFTFTEAMQRLQPSARDRWVFDLLQEHGVRDGFYCPQGSWMAVFTADRVLTETALTREDRVSIDVSANVAVYRLKEITARAQAAEAADLSPRELMALHHFAAGERPSAIAERMGLSENSVRTYLKRAQRKLRAKSPVHAAVLAVRQRLI